MKRNISSLHMFLFIISIQAIMSDNTNTTNNTDNTDNIDNLIPTVLYSFDNSIPFKGIEYEDCIPSVIRKNSKGDTFISLIKKENSSCPVFAKLIVVENSNTPYFKEWPNNDKVSFTSITNFEIDKHDTFFILDQASLFIISNSSELINRIDLSNYIDSTNYYLSDIVLDVKNNYAFISNSISYTKESSTSPQLIIVNYTLDKNEQISEKAIKIFTHKSFYPDKSLWLHINNNPVNSDNPIRIGLANLAISCNYEDLYYSPLTSHKIYSIPLENIFDYDEFPEPTEAYKGFMSSSLLMSGKDHLYLTDLDHSLIRQYRMLTDLEEIEYHNILPFKFDHKDKYLWPSSMTIFDNQLFYISNNYHLFMSNDSNIRVKILNISIESDDSYVNGCSYEKFSWDYQNIIMWFLFGVLILVVLSFVLMSSHKQEESVNKIEGGALID